MGLCMKAMDGMGTAQLGPIRPTLWRSLHPSDDAKHPVGLINWPSRGHGGHERAWGEGRVGRVEREGMGVVLWEGRVKMQVCMGGNALSSCPTCCSPAWHDGELHDSASSPSGPGNPEQGLLGHAMAPNWDQAAPRSPTGWSEESCKWCGVGSVLQVSSSHAIDLLSTVRTSGFAMTER
jgi:hypothetical protein